MKGGGSRSKEDHLWPQCPVCRREMHEPRLLDCLHPICTNCTMILKQGDTWNNQEDCPICEYPLPGPESPVPPPHYPLQHRLIMEAVLSRRVSCYCDSCANQATLHCSTCLRNYCLNCGEKHCKIRRSTSRKNHEVWPLWKAKRFRRTTVCLEHPEYPLRFFCIACQQVICSECLWRGNHRGHASEGHVEAATRAAGVLTNVIKTARCLLDSLLLHYNDRSFSCQQNRASMYLYGDFTSTTLPKNFPKWSDTFSGHWKRQQGSLHEREARERINEYLRLTNARFLLDAISLTEQLLGEGSDAEILSLGGIILKRFKTLGVNVRSKSTPKEKHQHSGVFHCCTFCSSGGKKEASCACGGTMPGGYKGCGHGHLGHPRKRHWSCCGSTNHQSVCPQWQTPSYLITL